MEKIWEDIPNYEGLYKINSKGDVLNIKRNRLMKKAKDKDGYEILSLTKNSQRKQYKIHRLVAETYIPNPNNYLYINHINEIKGDNRVENLEWCSASYNNLYGNRMKKIKKRVGRYDKHGNLLEIFDSVREAKDKYYGYISGCCKGKVKSVKGFVWKYIEEEK